MNGGRFALAAFVAALLFWALVALIHSPHLLRHLLGG